ncbi:Srsf2, partial [Symbiodinium necroappetens]
MPLPVDNLDELHSLKVDGLYPDTRKDEVWDFFRKCGRIGDVYLPRDHSSQKNRGFAFVRFYDRRDAEMCVQDG